MRRPWHSVIVTRSPDRCHKRPRWRRRCIVFTSVYIEKRYTVTSWQSLHARTEYRVEPDSHTDTRRFSLSDLPSVLLTSGGLGLATDSHQCSCNGLASARRYNLWNITAGLSAVTRVNAGGALAHYAFAAEQSTLPQSLSENRIRCL